MSSPVGRWPLAAIASLTLLAACGSETEPSAQASAGASDPSAVTQAQQAEVSQDTVTPSDPPSGASATTAAEIVVPELLNFTAQLVGGGEFSGAAAAGRTTAFWFWAPT